ncbi:hypothetical protein PG991_007268 [Apiospora marii]|uniref:Uncharacterized protein n=1 Tax=Apiospora marii TaxID=335849 RepID=A0ABR1RV22_9PEZI
MVKALPLLEVPEVKDGAAHLVADGALPTLSQKSPLLYHQTAKVLHLLVVPEVKDGAARLMVGSDLPTPCQKSPSLSLIPLLLFNTQFPMNLAVVKPAASLKADTAAFLQPQQSLSLPLVSHPVGEAQVALAALAVLEAPGALEVQGVQGAQLARLSLAATAGQAQVTADQEVKAKEVHHQLSLSPCPTLMIKDIRPPQPLHLRSCLPCLAQSLLLFPVYLGLQWVSLWAAQLCAPTMLTFGYSNTAWAWLCYPLDAMP